MNLNQDSLCEICTQMTGNNLAPTQGRVNFSTKKKRKRKTKWSGRSYINRQCHPYLAYVYSSSHARKHCSFNRSWEVKTDRITSKTLCRSFITKAVNNGSLNNARVQLAERLVENPYISVTDKKIHMCQTSQSFYDMQMTESSLLYSKILPCLQHTT